MKLWLVFVLASVVNGALRQHNPLKDPNICGRPTCNGGGKFSYAPGTQLRYRYLVDIGSLFAGTSKNESTLHVKAQVSLDFLTQCEGLLTLSDLKLSEKPDSYGAEEDLDTESPAHPNSELFSDSISQYPLRFSIHNGVISEVCPHDEEPNWVLNFKKGVLSLLHNTMERFDLDHSVTETDVRGACATNYTLEGALNTSLIIRKTKDLSLCESRYKFDSAIQSTHYHFRSQYQALEIIKSTSSCELTIDHRIYKEIKCEESHVFQPFSNQAAGATAITKQRLILLEEVNGTVVEEQPSIVRRSPLLYDHVPSPKPTSGELKISRDLIKRLCKQSTDDLQIEFSDLFTKFIRTSRRLSTTALSTLYAHSGTVCPTGKKHMLDALPYIGSSAAVTLMKNIIVKRGVSDSTVEDWMLILSVIPRPDDEMLGPVDQLLRQRINNTAVALSVSTLVHSYCRNHANCIDNEHVHRIVDMFEKRAIASYKDIDGGRVTQENLLVMLKSIGNMGIATDKFKQRLIEMMEDKNLEPSFRVAAAETHRRFPCEAIRPYFEELFRNPEGDTEVRIAAYLQVMRCPNYLVIRTIKHCLEIEEVNQVGSFIWSHLHNLLKSSIPSRVEIQGLLSDKDLGKKFSSDVRKFSHNYEGSVFFDEYNAGANYESNVIFSPTSYVPKSAMLNLTVDLFGESINLFEVNSRTEGFEHYLESIFGPQGPLSPRKLQDTIPKLRLARSVSENDVLKSQIDKLPNVLKKKPAADEPKVSLGFKVFGNELKYSTFNGDAEIRTALDTLNPVDHLKRILSGKEINYNKAAMFLDGSYIIPSAVGFPICLNAIGTAAINLKLFGSLRTADIFSKKQEIDLVGNLKPSVALDVVGTMSVDAFYANTGIKLKTSLYTSTAVEGNIKVRGTKLVSVKFNLPMEKTEIFGAQSELIVLNGDKEEYQSGKENIVSKSLCSWPTVDRTIGLKLCADYYLPNVTKVKNASYFILNGPSAFRVSLRKADPTAKTYLLEYKWDETKSGSVISVVFDTPGSSVRRLLSANLTLDDRSQNLTLLMESVAGTVLARGKYKYEDKEKYVDIGLDINGKKHFDAHLSLLMTEFGNGYTYHPVFYLGVSGERVAGLNGTLKWVNKKGISQCDVNLSFTTKRFRTKLFGYISKSDVSIATNLKLDYQFLNKTVQAVRMEFKVVNKSTPTLYAILSDLNLESTQYPQFNFVANSKYQKADRRMEYKMEINSGPHPKDDKSKLTLQLKFTFQSLKQGLKTESFLSVTRPNSDLDMRIHLKHEHNAADTNTFLLVRYAKGKDIVITFFLSQPRGKFLHTEGRLNVTLPSFTPMVLEGKIHEKHTSNIPEFDVELSATWFSGHNLTARGVYQDKSTSTTTNHHVKALLKSPSFNDISVVCSFYRDNSELKIDLKADHNNEEYWLFFKHASATPHDISTYGKIKYKSKLYSITSLVELRERRRILLELHMDQLRDIHLTLWGHNAAKYKGAGLEIKWDANRDPSQKLALLAEFANPRIYNYTGRVVVSYPGRELQGLFDFAIKDAHYWTSGRLAWSATEAIDIKLNAEYKSEPDILVTVTSELLTPFDNWKKTSINGGFHHSGNMYHCNGSVYWSHDRHVSIDLFEDYLVTGPVLDCELRAALISTIKEIPSISGNVKHHHNATKLDTSLRVTYDPKQVIAIKSVWQIDEDRKMKNLTGSVSLISPFAGYNKGLLVSKIYLTEDRDIRGIADLDLNFKKYTASIEGSWHKITKNKLVFNITTPIEKYKTIRGRFGFSEENRHLVAEIKAPTVTAGIEILFVFNSISDFDVKFSLGTPIDFLQKVGLRGLLKKDRVDFRLGWNSLVAGFAGIWHYANGVDFEYSYKIYTPIEGFEENGIVARLIFKEGLDGLDTELSVKFAQVKLGVAAVGRSKPKILKELGIKTKTIYIASQERGDEEEDPDGGEDGDDDEEDDEEDEPLSWAGQVEIDTLLYPTIKGTLDIDELGPQYNVYVTLTLPDGVAELKDEFTIHDIFNMKNRLLVTTPYVAWREITSKFDFLIKMDKKYSVGLDFNVANRTNLIESGARLEYTTDYNEEVDTSSKGLVFHVHTPFKVVPRIDLQGFLEMEENIYRINFTLTTNSSDISVAASAERDEGLLDLRGGLHVITPRLQVPPVKIALKKDFSEVENKIEFGFEMPQNATNNVQMEIVWIFNTVKNFRANFKVESPLIVMGRSEAAVSMLVDDDVTTAFIQVFLYPVELKADAHVQDNILEANILFDFNKNRQEVALNCAVLKPSSDRLEFRGTVLINARKYLVEGWATLSDDLPVKLQLDLKPNDDQEPLSIQYQLQPQATGYAVRSLVNKGLWNATLEAHTTSRDRYNWDMQLEIKTSEKSDKSITVICRMASSLPNNTSIVFEAQTPLKGLESLRLETSFGIEGIDHKAGARYALTESSGDIQLDWRWLLMEDMALVAVANYKRLNYTRLAAIETFYHNPNKSFEFLKTSFDTNLDNQWQMGSNLTLSLPPSYEKIDVAANLKLPAPKPEVHSLRAKIHTTKKLETVVYLLKYFTQHSRRNYGSSGNVVISNNKTEIVGNIRVEWGPHHKQAVNNFLDFNRINDSFHLLYKLHTPKFNEDTFMTKVVYKPPQNTDFHNISCMAYYPANVAVFNTNITFKELANMNGSLNVTTPFKKMPYIASNFSAETTSMLHKRYMLLQWPNNTALLDSLCHLQGTLMEREAKGTLLLEVPLTTRHVARVDYGYKEKPLFSMGHATVHYNKTRVLEGKYNCLSEARAGFEGDTIDVELENKLAPVGVKYVRGYEYSAPGDGNNTPTVDRKRLQVFHLHNRTAFNVTGEFYVRTTASGQEVSLTAIHSNRTVTLRTDYDVLDQRFIQRSRLQLAPDVWIAYDVDLINKTEDAMLEAQQIEINVSYPRRNFTALGSYSVSNSSLSSEMSLLWDKKEKTIQAAFDWRKIDAHPNRHEVELQIKHPSFEKNVSFHGGFQSSNRTLAEANLTVDYSDDEDHVLQVGGKLMDLSRGRLWNYTYEVSATHPATTLQLHAHGAVNWKPRWYQTYSEANYQRSFLPRQSGQISGRLDFDNTEIELQKKTHWSLSHLWGRYAGEFPLYTINVSAIRGEDINASGEFCLNFSEKLLQLELNMTADGSQSLHMYGIIPDARSATFDIWRDYEDIRVSDVAYFLRLNHSRLIVSKLHWRPELKQNIKGTIRDWSVDLYREINETITYYNGYITSESMEAMMGVWSDAEPKVQGFLDDLKELKVILEDFEEFKIFLNDSYHANEFHIRDIVSFGMRVIDELSIRSHIESLPAIVNEIWEVMGESGQAIRKSILWIIDTVKKSYQKAGEFVNGLVRGESLKQISAVLEQLVEKYDKFIKDLHVSFIRYMERLWNQTYAMLLDNWHKTLAGLEPTFLKFIHYLETIVWNTSKEFLDFLYNRKKELVESPYFHQFTNFTHDLDCFYKDITGNDTLGSIYKYSTFAWNFIKEKYFAMVPFGKELQDIVTEIITELKEVKNIPSVNYLIEKCYELYGQAKWFYDYFDVGPKIHNFLIILHTKLTDITQTALQAETRYREAKTKFIFEPSKGILELEQKLPMSWHAFNETPKFQEIPEYKAINDMQNYFVASNRTFWTFYNEYKPYTDPSDWLPPFKAYAMLVGRQHYMTFDSRFYDFQGKCTYLLASDFQDRNFTIAVSYGNNAHELYLLINNTLLHIDVFNSSVRVGSGAVSQLPAQLGDAAFVYRDADVITVESATRGFLLRCNMKFEVCVFEASGYYFGKTAGLWGTINNEPSDDTLSSMNLVEKNLGQFAKSWSLESSECRFNGNLAVVQQQNASSEVQEFCKNLYKSKVSQFSTCFSVVSPDPFVHICLTGNNIKEACSSALAYINICSNSNTPLRIPDVCVRCNSVNGSEVPEGNTVLLEGNQVPQSADVVFIVEAKSCNENIKKHRNIDILLASLNKELTNSNLTNNRYGVVVFGGPGVWSRPRSVVIDNDVFAEHQLISKYFDKIPIGNGSVDIFGAISFAARLVFRPGVSKNFILLPCSHCRESNMKLDYTSIHQLLVVENDITLHILMNEEFRFEKTRLNKIFFGIDLKMAFTKKDVPSLVGEPVLRKQVRLPKTTLGYCIPLALESNGTIFSALKLESEKRRAFNSSASENRNGSSEGDKKSQNVRKFATVFAKRVARTATPSDCQKCECTAPNTGMATMECKSCRATPEYLDYGFNEDDSEEEFEDMSGE